MCRHHPTLSVCLCQQFSLITAAVYNGVAFVFLYKAGSRIHEPSPSLLITWPTVASYCGALSARPVPCGGQFGLFPVFLVINSIAVHIFITNSLLTLKPRAAEPPGIQNPGSWPYKPSTDLGTLMN